MANGVLQSNREVMDWMKDFFTANAASLGLEYVGYGEENLIPGYPAVVFSSNTQDQTLHATHQFLMTMRIDIWVLHADLNVSKQQRTKKDMILCEAIDALLIMNMKLPTAQYPNGQIIGGWINSQHPGIMHRKKSETFSQVVSTRMTWEGTSIKPF